MQKQDANAKMISPIYSIIWLILAIALLLTTSLLSAMAHDDKPHLVAEQQQQHPAVASLRFLQASGAALANRDVWVLCFTDAAATITRRQQWLHTDGEGRPTTALPADCPYVAALLPLHNQPSGKPDHGPAYTLYAASWRTGSGAPTFTSPGCIVACPAGGDVVIREEWPLILFDVVASLEWEPEPGSAVVNQLWSGLRAGSAYLADLTDGYMAFGNVTIYTGGNHWDSADLRFHVANDLRPGAYVGGIVSQTIVYSASIAFRPAATFFGRAWAGRNAYFGSWDQPAGYRTIIHEWAHYALFLYDEYQDANTLSSPPPSASSYCTDNALPTLSSSADPHAASAMAYHYRTSEFWHPNHIPTPAGVCNRTDQWYVHGHSDWETLEQWYTLQGLAAWSKIAPLVKPAGTPEPGPTLVVLDAWGPLAALFAHTPDERGRIYLPLVDSGVVTSPSGSTFATRLTIFTNDSPLVVPDQRAQVYLFKSRVTTPTQILYEGQPIGNAGLDSLVGAIDLLGVQANDDLRIYVDRYATAAIAGGRFIYPPPGATAVLSGPVQAAPVRVEASLDLQFRMVATTPGAPSLLNGVRVILTGTTLIAPVAQLCSPAATIGCPAAWRALMVPASPPASGRWIAEFSPLADAAEFPLYFVVQVSDPQSTFEGITRQVRDLGSVGPGHMLGGAPIIPNSQREGMVTVDYHMRELVDSPCNRVLAMPAASYQALVDSLPSDYRLVGQPLDIDLLTGDPADDGYCTRELMDDKFRLTLFFQQLELDRLGIDASQLAIIFHPAVGVQGSWQISNNQTVINGDLNWAEQKIYDSGIYALVAKP